MKSRKLLIQDLGHCIVHINIRCKLYLYRYLFISMHVTIRNVFKYVYVVLSIF